MPLENPDYVGLNLNHGKDRCAGPPREFRHFSKYVLPFSSIDELSADKVVDQLQSDLNQCEMAKLVLLIPTRLL
jgi:hypothetical protein